MKKTGMGKMDSSLARLTPFFYTCFMKEERKIFKKRIKDTIISTRPWSFSMSLISVSVGTLLAA